MYFTHYTTTQKKFIDDFVNILFRKLSKNSRTPKDTAVSMNISGLIRSYVRQLLYVLVVDLIMNSTFTLLGCFMMIMQLSMQSTLYGFIAIKCKTKGDIACFILNLVALVLFIVVLIIKLLGLE